MEILVINGSPKGENSDCMQMTRAFLRGMGESASTVWAHSLNVKPCLGCFRCWRNGGRCVLDDDMRALIERVNAAELVIWSFPLYCYGMPAPIKAIIDRTLPGCTSEQEVDENGRTYHPARDEHITENILISGSGFPNIAHNFEGLSFQFKMLFGEHSPQILCCESPLFGVPEAAHLTEKKLKEIERAGREYARTRSISKDTLDSIAAPMMDPDEYRRTSS